MSIYRCGLKTTTLHPHGGILEANKQQLKAIIKSFAK